MSRWIRFIFVTLICLLTTAGTVSRLHHHTDGDGICFCIDCDGADDCDHHHDGERGHDDGDSCPFKLDVFKLSADSDLTFLPDGIALSAYISADCCLVAESGKAEYGCHKCHFCKSPVIIRFGLRSPPRQFSC